MGLEKGKILYLDMWAGDLVHERKFAGISRYAEMRGWEVVPVGDRLSRPDRVPGVLAKHRPVGCIIESSSGHLDLVPRLFRGIPTVWLDCQAMLHGGLMPRVIHDSEATTREAFRELSSNAPDSYAVVGHEAGYFWSRIRVRAFRSLAKAEGKRCDVFTMTGRGRDHEKRLEEWIGALPSKCAVFAVNDVVALDVVNACEATGRRIPSDLTLIGVDNRESICESASLSISSVQIDFERAGYRAAMLVDDLIAGRGEKIKTFGPLMTVRRESTRGFGRREPRMLAAIDLIRKEACGGLRASEVVRLFKGSRRLVDLRFRETFGHSILDEIQNVRFEKVFFLLSQTETALGAIAGLCGFKSEITLREQFRLRTGMSMSAWRKANAVR